VRACENLYRILAQVTVRTLLPHEGELNIALMEARSFTGSNMDG